jgi:hypothetical protein
MRLQGTAATGAGIVIGARPSSPIPSFANSIFGNIPSELATDSNELGQDHATGDQANATPGRRGSRVK